jgi:hypothetical protein
LDINTLEIVKIETSGEIPGWMSRHKSYFDGDSIITVEGGKLIVDVNGKEDYINNEYSYELCLKSMRWEKLSGK